MNAQIEAFQLFRQPLFRIAADSPRDGVDAMHMHDDPLRHQRMHGGLDRWPQTRCIKISHHKIRARLAGRVIPCQCGQQRVVLNRNKNVEGPGIPKPGAGGLDPHHALLLQRRVASRRLHQQGIGADAGRKLFQGREFSHCGNSQGLALQLR